MLIRTANTPLQVLQKTAQEAGLHLPKNITVEDALKLVHAHGDSQLAIKATLLTTASKQKEKATW